MKTDMQLKDAILAELKLTLDVHKTDVGVSSSRMALSL